jgi:cytochrome c
MIARRAHFERSSCYWCAALALALTLGAAPIRAADDIPALLTQKRCDACHHMSSALIGPSYIAIATRYRADKEGIAEVLARKIQLGGGGNWGVVPMVPNEHVTLEDARAIVRWILAIEPAGTSG